MKENIELIKERKQRYGDNFKLISSLWSDRFGITITEQEVALAMSDLKTARLHFNPKDIDSMQDRENYIWIAYNYEDYKEL
jgi:hypothetical protein